MTNPNEMTQSMIDRCASPLSIDMCTVLLAQILTEMCIHLSGDSIRTVLLPTHFGPGWCPSLHEKSCDQSETGCGDHMTCLKVQRGTNKAKQALVLNHHHHESHLSRLKGTNHLPPLCLPIYQTGCLQNTSQHWLHQQNSFRTPFGCHKVHRGSSKQAFTHQPQACSAPSQH